MWATSIGSTFSQIPSPGERKSGIPDGTEIPAPVNATTEPAPRTSFAKRSTSDCDVARERTVPSPPTLGPFEVGRPFDEERCDALLRVPALERGRKSALLRLDPLVQI